MQTECGMLISATLRIEKRIIANEFSTIFDSIKNSKKDMLAVIRCKEITTEKLSKKNTSVYLKKQ